MKQGIARNLAGVRSLSKIQTPGVDCLCVVATSAKYVSVGPQYCVRQFDHWSNIEYVMEASSENKQAGHRLPGLEQRDQTCMHLCDGERELLEKNVSMPVQFPLGTTKQSRSFGTAESRKQEEVFFSVYIYT